MVVQFLLLFCSIQLDEKRIERHSLFRNVKIQDQIARWKEDWKTITNSFFNLSFFNPLDEKRIERLSGSCLELNLVSATRWKEDWKLTLQFFSKPYLNYYLDEKRIESLKDKFSLIVKEINSMKRGLKVVPCTT